jgi:hypothetical protein
MPKGMPFTKEKKKPAGKKKAKKGSMPMPPPFPIKPAKSKDNYA